MLLLSDNSVNKINRQTKKCYSKALIFMLKEDTSDEYNGDKIDKDNFENSSKDSKQIDFKTSN